ncbi:MAG: hypothetical protein JXR61_14090 [Prolixibacteraceae bacterium]|nr:hypothetical protein [Prolixibacteraceae bacterium]
MVITKKDIELFELLSHFSAEELDKASLFLGEYTVKSREFEKSFNKLASLELIAIKNDRNETIIKLPNFQQAILLGGLNEFAIHKLNKIALEQELLESTIKTNKNSRNSNRIALIIGALTLGALIVEIFINLLEMLINLLTQKA